VTTVKKENIDGAVEIVHQRPPHLGRAKQRLTRHARIARIARALASHQALKGEGSLET